LLAAVCHDAGGAQIISSWLRRYLGEYCCVTEGPAENIFEQKLGKQKSLGLNDAIESCEWVLCGSSWQSNLEKRAIRIAKNKKKKSVAFLDHWVCYKERFIENGLSCLPDEIWVADRDALEIAKNLFSETKVLQKTNPYFEDIKNELAEIAAKKRKITDNQILYVCEPISEQAMIDHKDPSYFGYTEKEALTYFLKNIHELGEKNPRIIIRPHPAEPRNKYDWVIGESMCSITIRNNLNLLEEIINSHLVVGCESMALVIALMAGKRVICSIPDGPGKCGLPHSGIEYLRDLKSRSIKLRR
jgi:hypothetical protein